MGEGDTDAAENLKAEWVGSRESNRRAKQTAWSVSADQAVCLAFRKAYANGFWPKITDLFLVLTLVNVPMDIATGQFFLVF